MKKALKELIENAEETIKGAYEKGYSDGRMAREAEIVRCKECAYKQYYFTNDMVKCGCGNGAHHETFFCADGERREEGDRLVMPPADGSTIKVDGERREND